MNTDKPVRYGFLLLPNYSMLAYSSAVEVLRMANRLRHETLYEWPSYTLDGQAVAASNGVTLLPDHAISEMQDLRVLFVCSGMRVMQQWQPAIKTHLVGVYNFHNIAAALAIGSYFKLTPQQLKTGIESYVPANNRSQIIQQNSNQILLDAYNANPSSMEAALTNFNEIKNKNKLAILGDMFELGVSSAREHLAVVNQAVLTKDCSFYFVGTHFFEQHTEHSTLLFFETFQDLQIHLEKTTILNTSILIKGSRGMALERALRLI